MKRRKIIRHSAAYLALGVLIIIALFPYFWMITCAIRDQNEIFISPPKLWSSNVSLDSFERILTETKLPRYMLNSLITSLMATAMCIFCAIPAGYALARFQFKGKNTVTTGILLVKLLPQTATLIPLYIMDWPLPICSLWYPIPYGCPEDSSKPSPLLWKRRLSLTDAIKFRPS